MSMDSQATELVRRLTFILEAALPSLDKLAEDEARREAGKGLRQITNKQRAAAAHRAVQDGYRALGMEMP
jgi:hypothetical protein